MASYRVEIVKSAVKDLRGISPKLTPKITRAIEALESDPRPVGCKKLVGSEHTYRIRIGDYRVVYDLLDEVLTILVIRIRHRRDAYRL